MAGTLIPLIEVTLGATTQISFFLSLLLANDICVLYNFISKSYIFFSQSQGCPFYIHILSTSLEIYVLGKKQLKLQKINRLR